MNEDSHFELLYCSLLAQCARGIGTPKSACDKWKCTQSGGGSGVSLGGSGSMVSEDRVALGVVSAGISSAKSNKNCLDLHL